MIDPFALLYGNTPETEWAAIDADRAERAEVAVAQVAAERAAILARPECPRCCGTGVLHAYWHVDNGRCFRCGGTGKDPR